MDAKRLRLVVAAVVITLLSYLFGLFTGRISARPSPPNLDDPQIWLPIKTFRGELYPDSPPVVARVSAIYRLSDDKYPYTVLQNRIEISVADRLHRFFWPTSDDFVAGSCDILDVDGDGVKEFSSAMTGVGDLIHARHCYSVL